MAAVWPRCTIHLLGQLAEYIHEPQQQPGQRDHEEDLLDTREESRGSRGKAEGDHAHGEHGDRDRQAQGAGRRFQQAVVDIRLRADCEGLHQGDESHPHDDPRRSADRQQQQQQGQPLPELHLQHLAAEERVGQPVGQRAPSVLGVEGRNLRHGCRRDEPAALPGAVAHALEGDLDRPARGVDFAHPVADGRKPVVPMAERLGG
jgi:hypothetical protein